jgi:tetratricopeptide (TPR) repeat protein
MVKRPTAEVAGNYHPVTVLSLAVNYAMGKGNFPVYYGTNLFFHLLNTLLVFFLVFLMFDKKWLAALITAFFFGIHPMHVESVAWIAERKDVLYTFFFLLTLIGYLRYRQTNKTSTYILILLLFALSLLSKPAAVVLPVVLLLIDWYQKRKLDRKLLLEKVPFFVGALAIGLITMNIQESAGALTTHTNSFLDKIMVASYGFITYIAMLIVPIKQAAYHAYPAEGFPLIYKISPLIALGLAGLAIGSKKFGRIGLFGALFYLINIALVLQIISVGDTVISERYTYVPYIGLLLLVGLGVQYLLEKNTENKNLTYAIYGLLALLAVGSIYATWQRVKVWENTDTLFTDAIEKYPHAPRPYVSRGHYRGAQANLLTKAEEAERKRELQDSAIADYNRALAIQPDYMAYNNVGDILMKRNQVRSALTNFQKAVEIKSNFAIGYGNIASCQYRLGQKGEAMKSINQAIQLNGRQGAFYYIRSLLYKDEGNKAAALADARRAQQFAYPVPQNHLNELR